jgi:uncharacterized membrane protein YcfT
MDVVSYSRPAPIPAAAPVRPGRSRRPDRVAWVDTAKGICIIFVVMMHSTLGVGIEMGGEGFMHWVVAFAKPFRMPDFFLVSGLFLGRVIDRDWRIYADKRVVHFLYFYLLWLVIQSAFKYGQISGGTPAGFITHLAEGLVEPYSTLWFIYILAIFSAVTKLLRPVPQVVLFAAAVALQVLPIETGWFLLDQFCERWVYFVAGYIFAARIFKLADSAGEHQGAALLGLGVWAVVNGALALTPVTWMDATTAAELPVIGLALGLAGALAIVALASVITRAGIAEAFRYCGRNSIAIYLAFFLPMALTRTILIRTGIITDIGLISLLTTAVAVLVPLLIERALRHTPLFILFRRPAWAHLPAAAPARGLQPAE